MMQAIDCSGGCFSRCMDRLPAGSAPGITGNGAHATIGIIFSVKGGKLKATDVRDLRGVLEREIAEIGVLLSFGGANPPAAPLQTVDPDNMPTLGPMAFSEWSSRQDR